MSKFSGGSVQLAVPSSRGFSMQQVSRISVCRFSLTCSPLKPGLLYATPSGMPAPPSDFDLAVPSSRGFSMQLSSSNSAGIQRVGSCSPLKPGLLYATPPRRTTKSGGKALQSPQAGAFLSNPNSNAAKPAQGSHLQSPQAGASLCNQTTNERTTSRWPLAV